MGTNFYMITKNKKIVNEYTPYSYELIDWPYFGYKIHVAKTSKGWLPLFQSHYDGINSVREYKEAYDTNEFEIYDEYGDKYTWEEFDERVLQFNGGKLGVMEPTYIPDEDTYIPFSHISGNKQSYKYQFESDNETMFLDDDGYEFTSNDFG